ncbi:MAG: major capsid protein [Opitutaceae bacterium]|jgi:hypothetical protein
MAGFTALDIAKLNASDEMAGLVEKNKNVAPELSRVPAFMIKGLAFKTNVRLNVPEGGFKPLGGGVVPGKSEYDTKIVECFSYSNPLREMADVVRSHRKGQAYALALAASGAMKGAMEKIGRAFYYGATSLGGSTDSTPGLIDLYDSTNKVVDAGGTTASTGSSAWFVKFGNEEDGLVSLVFGEERVFALREWILQQIITNTTTGALADAWTNDLASAVGVQLNDIDAAVRIKKLTEDSGKGMTDSLGYKAIEKFPVGMRPDVCFMTKRSVRQLRDSRTGNLGGSTNTPWPTDVAGIPIVETDSISNVEALTL